MSINSVETSSDEIIMFGDKIARWYQIAALHQTEYELEKGSKRILIVKPTGVGKTFTAGIIFSSERIRSALNIKKNQPLRLLFLAHTHRILTQAERTFADASNVEFIQQSAFQDIPDESEWDIACIDEAHHEAMMSIQYRLDRLGDKPIIGLTATPDRADGCLIKFETIINPISRELAVEEGFLSPTFLHSIVDTNVKNKVPITKQIIDHYGHQFGQTMMFFRTKNEVREIETYLLEQGYSAIAILDQSNIQLDAILDDFSAGKFQFIINCKKINEGVDVAGCSDVFLGRSFGSYPQLNQVIGRASRPDCECNVWELINPLSGSNLDTTVVVGTPEQHRLLSKINGQWIEQEFEYTSQKFVSA